MVLVVAGVNLHCVVRKRKLAAAVVAGAAVLALVAEDVQSAVLERCFPSLNSALRFPVYRSQP